MKVKCLLCVGHSDNDIGYVQCRLLKGVVCYACCIEISHDAEDTREKVMKRLSLTTEDKIEKACDNCKPRRVKKRTLEHKEELLERVVDPNILAGKPFSAKKVSPKCIKHMTHPIKPEEWIC